ncbi:hypothetical protein TNCV_4363711 [Trichonephila clavipes]|nr:hypothetical protein TNCV_4363711 [Trichonephila clavipes]
MHGRKRLAGAVVTTYKNDWSRIRGVNLFSIPSTAKILGSIWLVYASGLHTVFHGTQRILQREHSGARVKPNNTKQQDDLLDLEQNNLGTIRKAIVAISSKGSNSLRTGVITFV